MQENLPIVWDNLYRYTPEDELSWREPLPLTSIRMISMLDLPKDAAIIDVGAGDSRLAKYLLALNFKNITLLDFSAEALSRAKSQLGELASEVKWIHGNILDIKNQNSYDLWHDRATFSFFNEKEDQLAYVKTAYHALKPDGRLILGGFAKKGPGYCNGLPVQQYSENGLQKLFGPVFEKEKCSYHQHITPSNQLQPFIYCSFRKNDFG